LGWPLRSADTDNAAENEPNANTQEQTADDVVSGAVCRGAAHETGDARSLENFEYDDRKTENQLDDRAPHERPP
jgi:hypothetical protein